MKKFEKVISGLIIGFTFPLLFGLLSVITWFYLDKSESRVLIYLTTGIVLGLIIDFKFLQIGLSIDLIYHFGLSGDLYILQYLYVWILYGISCF